MEGRPAGRPRQERKNPATPSRIASGTGADAQGYIPPRSDADPGPGTTVRPPAASPPARLPRGRMSIKSDRWIRRMARESGMIDPFVEKQTRQSDEQGRRVISYGVSSYGYDMRVAPEFKIFTNVLSAIVDPKEFDSRSFVEFEGPVCIVPPNSFALARSVEYFRIPRNVLTICVGKSTYARCGIITNVTPFEPEWEGHVTLEISNTTPLPAKIYANEGICQVLFFEADADDVCETSYADKAGKYQRQTGVTLPKL
jgi:dCTP deaminase